MRDIKKKDRISRHDEVCKLIVDFLFFMIHKYLDVQTIVYMRIRSIDSFCYSSEVCIYVYLHLIIKKERKKEGKKNTRYPYDDDDDDDVCYSSSFSIVSYRLSSIMVSNECKAINLTYTYIKQNEK